MLATFAVLHTLTIHNCRVQTRVFIPKLRGRPGGSSIEPLSATSEISSTQECPRTLLKRRVKSINENPGMLNGAEILDCWTDTQIYRTGHQFSAPVYKNL